MKPKNTKGPWVIAKDNQTIKSDETYICRIRYPFSPIDENDEIAANARLIAAAPEMYELLHAIWAKTDPSKDPKTCRAIANLLDRIDQTTKARGES